MKALAALFFVGFLSVGSTHAQDDTDVSSAGGSPYAQPSQADLLNTFPALTPNEVDALIHFQAKTVSRLLGIQFTADGVLPRIKRADHPLHLINPFAPAGYGFGEEVTSQHPHTGRAEGIVFLGLKF